MRTAHTMNVLRAVAAGVLLVSSLAACQFVPAAAPRESSATGDALGTPSNPLKLAFTPFIESRKVLASGEPMGRLLQQATNLHVRVSVPTSYTAVIEGLSAGQVDVAFLAPFAYVLARERGVAEPLLATVRQGSANYRSQIIVHADSGITSLDQLRGRTFAFVEPASASGFLFPTALLASTGIDYKTYFSQATFAGGHPQVVIAVYNKQVDGGATFGNFRDGPQATDARLTVQSTLPDVLDKVKPIAVSEPIPNDTIAVRRGLPAPLIQVIREGLLTIQATPEGKEVLRGLSESDGLVAVTDAEYDSLRQAARVLNLDLEAQLAPPKPRS